jgi:phage FluMu protein gp41
MFETEREFTLPRGYLDEEGTLHREGVMRLATAADEIVLLKDPRVQKNPAYLTVLLLSRVVTRLGGLEGITPKTIESLFASDLAYLQELYNELNEVGSEEPARAACPECGHAFEVERSRLGGSVATPSTS